MNSVRPALGDEDAVRPVDRLRGAARRVERAVHDGSGEGHEQGGVEALAGDVGDDDRERMSAPREAEQLEEVAADVTRRRVVAREVVAGDVRRLDRHDAALLPATLGELGGVDPQRLRRVLRAVGAERLFCGRSLDRLRDELPERDREGIDPRAKSRIQAAAGDDPGHDVPSTTTSADRPLPAPSRATSRPAIVTPAASTTDTDGPPGSCRERREHPLEPAPIERRGRLAPGPPPGD